MPNLSMVNGPDARPLLCLSFQVPCPKKPNYYTGLLAEYPSLA